jgi:hypothetical protein
MKKMYSMGLLLLVLVLMGSLLVACGSKETTETTLAVATTAAATDDTTATTAAATDDTTATTVAVTVSEGALALTVVADEAAVDLNTLDLYGIDEGNNVLMVWDVPIAGSKFPISTTNEYAMTVEALDANGAVLGTLQIDDTAAPGKIDYSAYADTAVKLRLTTAVATGSLVYEYLVP